MKQKLDEKVRVFAPVCKRKAAGANPAESTFFPSEITGQTGKLPYGLKLYGLFLDKYIVLKPLSRSQKR